MVLKRTLSIFLAVLMIGMTFTAFPITVNAASNTWDPVNDVYDITTEDDLFAFRDALSADGLQDGELYGYFYGKTINLMNNITLTRDWQCNSVLNGTDGDVFAGIFNGNNHTIDNINMVCTDGYSASFFPQLYYATVKDLTLKDVTVDTPRARFIGAFSCITLGGGSSQNTISNCHLEGNSLLRVDNNVTRAQWTGGIIGTCQQNSSNIKLENCSIGENVVIMGQDTQPSGNVNHFAGGMVGSADYDTNIVFENCVNYASVYGSGSNNAVIGGLLGILNRGGTAVFNKCENYGRLTYDPDNNVTGTLEAYIGGITGGSSRSNYSDGYGNKAGVLTVNECANYGDIYAKYSSSVGDVGGLVGMTFSAGITNSYNTGNITVEGLTYDSNSGYSNCVGGILGLFKVWKYDDPTGSNMRLENCYNTGAISLPVAHYSQHVGGVVGMINSVSEKPDQPQIGNVYNFGNISCPDNGKVGLAIGENLFTDSNEFYALYNGDYKIIGNTNSSVSGGYFTSADVDGGIYPVTRESGASEVVSDEPLAGNLLYTLNQWVSDKNAELENNGDSFRYLTWKMTNPASEDGYKGEGVHPMFGVQEFDIKFYPNFSDNEEPFRTYTAANLVMGKVPVFYDLPAHDGYIFKGWYLDKENNDDDSPISFDTVYTTSTDIYAHWIKVENVAKNENDPSILPGGETTYGGFDLAGVQIRKKMLDHNFEEVTPGGMRFITSLNMDVVNEINKIQPNNIEYGYVAATHEGWINYHCDGVKHGSDEKLKYVSTTANGINTSEGATNENYFGFAKNVNCTSKVTDSKNGVVRRDHQNFDKYLLYSLVITYEEEGSDMGKDVLARPYIRYKDANGLERVAYSEYTGTNVLGGCYTNYNTVAAKAGN